jgi:DNA-directed RNA polymerase subunit omega
MARITVEDCLRKTDESRFALVMVAAKRAKMLIRGARTLVESDNKAVVNALREIAAGKVYPSYEPLEEGSQVETPKVQLVEGEEEQKELPGDNE